MTATDPCWYEQFRGQPFPVDALPPGLEKYVGTHAAHYHVDTGFAAVTALVELAGTLGENSVVRSLSGNDVPVLLRAIIATPSSPGYSAAVKDSMNALEEIQNERVEAAAGLDRARIEELKHMPSHRLPEYARIDRAEPADHGKARVRVLTVLQQPCFLLNSPGARELRHGFASSHDRTLLVTGNLLKRVTCGDRGGKQLTDLLARACQNGQIDVPCPGGKQMIQPRLGFLCLTDSETLDAAVTTKLPDVATITRHSILLKFPQSTATANPTYAGIADAGAYWRQTTQMLYQSRLSLSHGYPPHPCFHVPLVSWHQKLQQVAGKTPTHLQPYLTDFSQLPLQLASLFVALHCYGGPREQVASESAIQVTEWLLAQTLISVSDVYANVEHGSALTAANEMLGKIAKHGPIDAWRLVRHYHNQDIAVHKPVLDALLRQGRIRSNELGQLLAA